MVALFSLGTDKIEATLKGDGHSGAITSICYDGEASLYTAGEDGKIIVWSLSQGTQTRSWEMKNERPSALTLSTDNQRLISASRQIKVWLTKTQECKQTFTGHASAVQFLRVVRYADDSEYLVSASKLNRVLSVWNLRATTKKKDSMATFTLEDVPVFVDVICEDDHLVIIAVCRNNAVYYFREAMDQIITSTKPFKSKWFLNLVAKTKVGATPKSVEPLPVLSVALTAKDSILVGYGNTVSINFESIPLDVEKRSQVLVRNDPRKMNVKSGVQDSRLIGQMRPIVDENQVEYSMIPTPAKRNLKPNEIQIEKRLENLSLVKGDGATDVAPATNVTQLLIQGLHSSDSE